MNLAPSLWSASYRVAQSGVPQGKTGKRHCGHLTGTGRQSLCHCHRECQGRQFRFVVRSGERELLAMSGPGGYADEKAAHKAIADLKMAMKTTKVMPTKRKSK